MSMRLAAPANIVDVNRLHELDYVRTSPDGVRVGALARHATVERDDAAAAAQPLLRQGLQLVAHPTIRNRGTTVGSLAHADPSGEMTAVLALTDGTVTIASADGRREVAATQFFRGPLESDVHGGELAVEAFFPHLAPRTGTAFIEVARRHGDYAVCGVAATVTLDAGYAVVSARTAYISCSPVPVVVDLTAAAPAPTEADTGWGTSSAAWDGAGDLALAQLDPEEDIHASAAYRAQLVRVLTVRALRDATAAATAETGRQS
jgi:carbon-monoxide dehydrogenase medium subunit